MTIATLRGSVLALLGIAALAGCSSHSTHPPAGSAAGDTVVGAPAGFVPAAAVVSGAGHALLVDAHDAALVSTDAGAHWTSLRLPGKPAAGDSVVVAGDRVTAVTVDAAGMRLQRSTDGGRSWQASPVPLTIPTDQAQLAVSPDGGRLAVLATVRGTANDGDSPQLYVQDAGGRLVARQAPAGGQLAWDGSRLLLTGGPLRTRLYASPDAGRTWVPVPVGGAVAPRFGVDPAAPSIGQPLAGAVGVTVPVTEHAGAAAVQLYTGTPGALVPGVRVPLASRLGSGVLAPVAAAGPSEIVVAEPGSSTLHLVTGHSQVTVHPVGLPGPVDALSFADAEHGVAQVTVRSCTGKQDCAESPEVLATSDGGRSWHHTG